MSEDFVPAESLSGNEIDRGFVTYDEGGSGFVGIFFLIPESEQRPDVDHVAKPKYEISSMATIGDSLFLSVQIKLLEYSEHFLFFVRKRGR